MSAQAVTYHAKAMKACLAVLWAEMARREQTHKAGIQAEIMKRIGPTPADADLAPEYVI